MTHLNNTLSELSPLLLPVESSIFHDELNDSLGRDNWIQVMHGAILHSMGEEYYRGSYFNLES